MQVSLEADSLLMDKQRPHANHKDRRGDGWSKSHGPGFEARCKWLQVLFEASEVYRAFFCFFFLGGGGPEFKIGFRAFGFGV